MKKEKFSFGIIGCGAIAGVHAKAIGAMEDAVLAAAYDSQRTEEKQLLKG